MLDEQKLFCQRGQAQHLLLPLEDPPALLLWAGISSSSHSPLSRNCQLQMRSSPVPAPSSPAAVWDHQCPCQAGGVQ